MEKQNIPGFSGHVMLFLLNNSFSERNILTKGNQYLIKMRCLAVSGVIIINNVMLQSKFIKINPKL